MYYAPHHSDPHAQGTPLVPPGSLLSWEGVLVLLQNAPGDSSTQSNFSSGQLPRKQATAGRGPQYHKGPRPSPGACRTMPSGAPWHPKPACLEIPQPHGCSGT